MENAFKWDCSCKGVAYGILVDKHFPLKSHYKDYTSRCYEGSYPNVIHKIYILNQVINMINSSTFKSIYLQFQVASIKLKIGYKHLKC